MAGCQKGKTIVVGQLLLSDYRTYGLSTQYRHQERYTLIAFSLTQPVCCLRGDSSEQPTADPATYRMYVKPAVGHTFP